MTLSLGNLTENEWYETTRRGNYKHVSWQTMGCLLFKFSANFNQISRKSAKKKMLINEYFHPLLLHNH